MKQFNFTENEKNVLKAIVENAREVGDTLIEFITADVAKKLNKSKNSVNGTVSNLAKKGAVLCFNGDGYFDGNITEDTIAWYDENFNHAKNDDFDKPAVDERIVTLNELRKVKMSSLSKSKKLAAKANKYSAQFVFENWDDVEALLKYVGNEDNQIHCYEVWCIAKSRIDQLVAKAAAEIAEAEKEEEPKADTTTSETAIEAPETPKAKKDTPKKFKGGRKRYNVGEHHPQHPDWIYTEYKPGKFDWRADKSVSKFKTDKKAEEVSKPTKENKPKTKKTSDKPKKDRMKVAFDKAMNVDEFIVALRGKNLSTTQKSHLKLLKKGYRISSDKRFFELENNIKRLVIGSQFRL